MTRGAGRRAGGFALVEMLAALAIAALLLAALVGVVSQAFDARSFASQRNDLTGQAGFAMDQMVRSVRGTRRLLLPLADKPGTSWREHVREQTVPPSPPEPGSFWATAVLAVTLPLEVDQDGDGTPDADNDGDGRVDEDLPADWDYSGSPGIHGIDDAGDGFVDNSALTDDDEYFFDADEDPFDGADDDGDGNVDEDPNADMNGDGAPGIAGVDDDGDGLIDDGSPNDDDEDGSSDEDWYDPVVFYLAGDTLMQRTPVPWDETGVGGITGRDYVESALAENVTRFRVERIPSQAGGPLLVDLTLELSGVDGEIVSLHSRVRVGGAP